jgi:hypothetical protein
MVYFNVFFSRNCIVRVSLKHITVKSVDVASSSVHQTVQLALVRYVEGWVGRACPFAWIEKLWFYLNTLIANRVSQLIEDVLPREPSSPLAFAYGVM